MFFLNHILLERISFDRLNMTKTSALVGMQVQEREVLLVNTGKALWGGSGFGTCQDVCGFRRAVTHRIMHIWIHISPCHGQELQSVNPSVDRSAILWPWTSMNHGPIWSRWRFNTAGTSAPYRGPLCWIVGPLPGKSKRETRTDAILCPPYFQCHHSGGSEIHRFFFGGGGVPKKLQMTQCG